MSPLLGGEFVIAFLALRIVFWIWRSRGEVGALGRGGDEPGGPDGGSRRLPPARPALRRVPPPADRAELPRAA